MKNNTPAPQTVDDYIAAFPPKVRKILKALRKTIKTAAPKAEEKISYRMPAYTQSGPLVYFAGYEKHIGLYPLPKTLKIFQKELSGYKSGKGSVQFPLDTPLPFALISRIVKFRITENEGKSVMKK